MVKEKTETPRRPRSRLILYLVIIVITTGVAYYREKARHVVPPAPLTIQDLPTSTFTHSPEGDEELVRLAKKYAKEDRASWHYEEWFIRDFFDGLNDGTFLDVGAYHWYSASNTVALEQKQGWSGLAIDAQVSFADGYEKNRPKTKFFAYFVSDESSRAKQFVVPENPALASASKIWVESFDKETSEVQEIDTITLDELLEREGFESIDFVNIDIEGWEVKALKGFDLAKYSPLLACVETIGENEKLVDAYFEKQGYKVIQPWSTSDTHNRWYSKGGCRHWSEDQTREADKST